MKRSIYGGLVASLVILGICPRTFAQAPTESGTPPVISAIRERMQAFVDDKQLAGVVTYISRGGKVVHWDASGSLDAAGTQPMPRDAIFYVASMTKPMSAAAVLTLVDEGKLSLDAPVARTLPEFAGPREKITLHHLVTHTSGLSGDQRNIGSLADTVREISKRTVAFEPGQRWTYSPGLTVAGRMIEVASGLPYDEFLQKRLFEPLGMTDSTFHLSDEKKTRLAHLVARSDDQKGLIESENWLASDSPNPSAGLYSTAHDYDRFLRMLLNGGELDGKRVLSEKIAKEMITSQTGDWDVGFVPGSAWGLGVGIVREPSGVTEHLPVGTFGHGGIFGTQAWADPTTQTVHLLLIQRIGIVNSDASVFRKAFHEAAAEALADSSKGS